MAKNQVFEYVDILSLPVPEGTKSGDVVVVGEFIGVAETDRSVRSDTGADAWDETYGGGNAEGHASVRVRGGAYRLDVTGAVNIGDPVYLNAAGDALSATGTGRRFGIAITTKGAGTGPVTVVLDPGPAAAAAGEG